jgi:flagellar protein FliO/FliZ
MLLLATAYSLQPSASFAERLFGAPSQNTSAPTSGFATAGQMTLALAVVLAAVFAAAWLMRRMRGFGHRNAQAIQVVADVSLGGKERAVLLQIGTTKVLVGVAPGQVNTLHVLGASESAEESAVGSPQSAAGEERRVSSSPSANDLSASFKAILKRSLGI